VESLPSSIMCSRVKTMLDTVPAKNILSQFAPNVIERGV